jgi:hypothetical protein
MNLLKRSTAGIVAIALATVAAGIAADAQKAQATAGTPITQCGTVITTPGNYVVNASLTSTSNTTDCIDVNTPGVFLAIADGVSLTGPGAATVTAAGIKIPAGSTGFLLNFSQSTIQGFGVGIDEEADAVSLSGGATGALVTGNAAQGILVKGATGVYINSVNCQKNGAAGLELSGASGVIVEGVPLVQDNGGYGLWVHSSSDNQFVNFDSFDNTLSGIYVGESATDRLSAKARDTKPSNDNVFVDSAAIENGGAGFVIDLGDSHNVVTISTGEGNKDPDAVDENKDCDHNTWSGNSFTTTSSTCIH